MVLTYNPKYLVQEHDIIAWKVGDEQLRSSA